MVNKEVWLTKPAMALITIVLLVLIAWSWSMFKPVDVNSQPHFMFSFPSSGSKEEALKNPMDVDVKNGFLAVPDSLGGRVNFYYTGGDYVKSLKVKEAKYLSAVAFDNEDGLYVGDLTAKKIYHYANPFKSPDKRRLFAKDISPVAILCEGDSVYVSDVTAGKILIYGPDGKIRKIMASVSFANGLAFDNGNLYVADSNNGNIILFKDGHKSSVLASEFSLPRGLAFDSEGNLHVVDTFSNTVKVIVNGKIKFAYGSAGGDKENFSYPNGIAIDKDNNRIYVADKGNDRIQVLGW